MTANHDDFDYMLAARCFIAGMEVERKHQFPPLKFAGFYDMLHCVYGFDDPLAMSNKAAEALMYVMSDKEGSWKD